MKQNFLAASVHFKVESSCISVYSPTKGHCSKRVNTAMYPQNFAMWFVYIINMLVMTLLSPTLSMALMLIET